MVFYGVNGFTVVLMVFTGFKSGFTFCLRFNKARKGGGREGGEGTGRRKERMVSKKFFRFGFETVGMVLKFQVVLIGQHVY